ncbi:hypothetical protein JHK85_008434 [Glycine max]|nr:hypothetical protein JHK85_008434 [Glycine max]
MERQRSFSFKPTRLLVFSFTIFSSILFLSTFTTWLTNYTPSIHQQIHLYFNTSTSSSVGDGESDSVALPPLTVHSLTKNLTVNVVKVPTLIDNRLARTQKSLSGSKSEPVRHHVGASNVNFTSMEEYGTSPERVPSKEEKKVVAGDLVGKTQVPILKKIEQKKRVEGFNATKMLELIRGKRLVFVGDSINRNQWESMLCMLLGAIKDPTRVYESRGRKITKEKGNYSFRFLDYQCTVEYYVSHFLVHESKARIGQKRRSTLRIDAIDHGSSRWRGADIVVFNTAHWWSHSKTQAGGGDWNSGGHCTEATLPLNKTLSTTYPEKNIIAEEVIKQMRTPVTLLNITSLSAYRIDGHPSIYGRKTRSSRIQDCSHWCLPGVPDTWNELLYFHLQSR